MHAFVWLSACTVGRPLPGASPVGVCVQIAAWSQYILAAYQDSGGVLLNVRADTPIGPLTTAEATINRAGEAQPNLKICGVR